jgi:putative copper export protein
MPSPADVAVAALHWVEYLGLIGAIGSMVVRRLAANSPRIGWARPPLHFALGAAFVGGLGVIVAEALGAGGSVSGAIAYLSGGSPGWVRIARVAAEGAALAACLLGRRFVAPLAIFAAAAVAFASHAANAVPAGGAIFGDALHVLSAGVWAGGIMALATLRPPGGWTGEEGRALLWRFGRVALIAFAITAMTGVLDATSELREPSDLWTTSYGLVLSAKSAGVLVMLVLSASAWRRGFGPVRYEAAVAALVLATTAVLAAYPLPPARVPGDGASAIPCELFGNTVYHYHIALQIIAEGNQVPIPTDVGRPGLCLYWLHMHASSPGVIHVESPVQRIFTLGDFFDVWAKTSSQTIKLDNRHVGTITLGAGQTLVVFVNGQRYDQDPTGIPLVSREVIQLEITPPIIDPPPTFPSSF